MVILRKPNLPLTILLAFAACTNEAHDHYHPTFTTATSNQHQLIFGAPSLAYFETTDLVVKYLNTNLDSVQIHTVACTSVEDYEDKLRKNQFDFTVINGPQLITAWQNGYTVVGRIADDYHSVIVANKDSNINTFTDCNGRSIALTGSRILAGSVMPLIYLYEHGVDVNKSINRLYCPSYESVLMDVCLGRCAIGAVWSTSYENFQRLRPDLAAHLQVKWRTPPLPSSGILFKRTLDSNLTQKITTLLLRLQTDPQGRAALKRVGIGGFQKADTNSYQPLKLFLRKYDSLIQ